MDEKKKIFGLIGEFRTPSDLLKAVKKLKEAGYRKMDVHSPFPIHGMTKLLGIRDSSLGYIVAVSALLGFAGAFALQTWAAVDAYPYVISGRPLFSWQSFLVIAFEITVLFSSFGAVLGMFALNKLPQLYHPVFKSENFKGASSDSFFIGIEATDRLFSLEKTREYLVHLGGYRIEVLEE